MATMPIHPGGAGHAQGPNLDGAQKAGLGIFGLALLGCIAGYLTNPEQLYRAYLTGFMVAGGLPVACLALLMLHHMVGGEWGVVLRRLLEAGTRALPYMLVLGLPIWAVMMPSLYLWTRPEVVAHDHVLQAKAPYLNQMAFYIRLVIYYAVWLGLTFKLNAMTREQEATREANGETATPMHRRLNNIAGPGLVMLVITVTFAAFDWSMSTDPHWFSTIFGLITLIGWGLTTLCLCVIALSILKNYAPMNHLLKQSHFHDLGNLMFAFTVLWAYMSFSQFIIIWSGNLPEEIPWFIRRMNTSWGAMMALLAICHFFLPFFLLLARRNKKSAERLRNVAIFYLFLRVTEQIWTVEPNFSPAAMSVSVLDYLLPAGFLGLFVALMAMELKKRPLVPVEPERIQAEHH
jgi:hypothetical protein